MQDANDLPVSVELDRSLVFMLAALSKSSLQEVSLNLMDLADACIVRLCKKKDKGYSARTKIVYPETSLLLNLLVKRSYNIELLVRDRVEFVDRFNKKFNSSITEKNIRSWNNYNSTPYQLINSISNSQGARSYCNKRCWPNTGNDKYETIKISASLNKDERLVSFTKKDLDTYLIENILLGSSNE